MSSSDDDRMPYVTEAEHAAFVAAGDRLSEAQNAFTDAAPEDADARWEDVQTASETWHVMFDELFRRSIQREREATRRHQLAMSVELERILAESRP